VSFIPELDTREIPSVTRKFKTIIGWKYLEKRFKFIESNIKSGTLHNFIIKKYKIEIALKEIYEYQKNTSRFLWPPNRNQLSAYSFMAMIVKTHASLSPLAQRRLIGRLIGGLKEDNGLSPIAFEMVIASNLLQNGFSVQFSDFENKTENSTYDFLAQKKEKKLEVECKFISGDKGKKIHQKEFYLLFEKLKDDLQSLRKNSLDNIFISITVKNRLEKSEKYIKELRADLKKLIKNPSVDIRQDKHKIEAELFSLDKKLIDIIYIEKNLRIFIQQSFQISEPNAFILISEAGTITIVNIQSKENDNVLDRIFDSSLKDTKTQFTELNPAILCCQLSDVNEEELRLLAAAQEQENTGIQIMSNMLLDRRPHLLGVGFMTEGEQLQKTSRIIGAPKIFSNQGAVYYFKNNNNKYAKDKDLDVFRFN